MEERSYNRDDHSKNFSFLMDTNGDWKFAPVMTLPFHFRATGITAPWLQEKVKIRDERIS